MIGIIATLLVAVVAVGVRNDAVGFLNRATLFVAASNDGTPSAEIAETKTLSKEDRLRQLKDKIAAYMSSTDMSTENDETVKVVATSTATDTPTEVVSHEEQRCGNYSRVGASWNPIGLNFEEVEGARIVYRENQGDASTTLSSKEIVLQLPLRSFSANAQRCISSDVIGITVGGALIRNTDISTYRVFGSDMLIGYALDGYPIYGMSTDKTDACGGRVVAGQYRYQISGEQKTIINCYSGSPVSI
jgi:hypothetical protein